MIRLHLDDPIGPINPLIYGHFTELTLTNFEGGVWSEMLVNRKFGILEESAGGPRSGTAAGWEPLALDTNITLHMDNRIHFSPYWSQRITITAPWNGPAGIQQSGYEVTLKKNAQGGRIAHPFRFEAGVRYRVRLAAKRKDLSGSVYVAVGESPEKAVATHAFELEGNDWKVYECVLVPDADADDAKLMIYIDSPGTVWIDSASLTQESLTEEGFRKDVIELAKTITPTILRWPGGCFADDYHWQDGIGPLDARPPRYNRAWMRYTTNDVGTDEFVTLCRLLGAEPYICVNYGTGSAEEAAAWVEYCNGGPETRWGKVRAENGHPARYNVKYWNVGNEVFLTQEFGATNGREYGKDFREFARCMRAVDPSIQLVAVGCFDIEDEKLVKLARSVDVIWQGARYMVGWTKGLMEEAGEEIDILSIHYYGPSDVRKAESIEQVNQTCMVISEDIGRSLDQLLERMSKYVPAGKHIPIALDEWSNVVAGGPPPPAPEPDDVPPDLEPRDVALWAQGVNLRKAIAEACVINLMQRRPRDIILGNRTFLCAHLTGAIVIRRDAVFPSPVALMMGLYATRESWQSLKVDVESGTFEVKPLRLGWQAVGEFGYLDASSRIHADGKTVDLFVVNRNLNDAIPCRIDWVGGEVAPDVDVAVLNAPDIFDFNTFDNPERIKIETEQVTTDGNSLAYEFPAHSLTKLTLRKK